MRSLLAALLTIVAFTIVVRWQQLNAIGGIARLALDPVRLAGLVFLGLVYGALRGRTRSLLAPAVAHVLTWVVWGMT